jgi:hypothetical protein
MSEVDNLTYAAFIKAFAPILLHLAAADNNTEIKNIIKEFQQLPEDATPDEANTQVLRDWVDSKEHEINTMTPDEITRIMTAARLQKISENSFHKRSYSLGKKRPRYECSITMEPIKRNEYYVDFLDNGKPYKVAAIIEYYKRMQVLKREDWRTPLRNTISGEHEELLEDLVKWYEGTKRCPRKRTATKKSKSPGKTISAKRKHGKSKSKSNRSQSL